MIVTDVEICFQASAGTRRFEEIVRIYQVSYIIAISVGHSACPCVSTALVRARPSLCVPKAPSHCRYPDLKGGLLLSFFPVSCPLVGSFFLPRSLFRQSSRLAQLAPSHAPRRVLARLRTAEQHAIEDGGSYLRSFCGALSLLMRVDPSCPPCSSPDPLSVCAEST